MANFPASGLNSNPQPQFHNPNTFPYNMYRCIHPPHPQHYPADVDTVLSVLAPHIRHLDLHGQIKDDLVHLPTTGVAGGEDHEFCINLDVGIFAPEELTVKVVNDHLIVEGRHDERQAHDSGYVTRHFKRRYELPKGYNPDAIVSKLSSDGILNVSLPKTAESAKVRRVNIQQIGLSYFTVKNTTGNAETFKTKNVTGNEEINDDDTDQK